MESGLFNNKGGRFLGFATLVALIFALGSYALLNLQKADFVNPMPAMISVTGEGEVMAVPDIGQFSFAVEAEGENANEAQEASGTKINKITAYLKEIGIEDKDIKTQNYNLYPNWRYEERICPVGSFCQGERVQDGFTVSQSIVVKVRDTEKAGEVISGVGDLGATNISNLAFTTDDTEILKAEARTLAIEDAKEKAKILAADLGVELLQMASYYEEDNRYEPYYDNRMMAMDESAGGEFGGPELPMGENSTMVRVNVTYQVK
jgi:uncharacterized protein YggE